MPFQVPESGPGAPGYEVTFEKTNPIGWPHTFLYHAVVSVVAFAALAYSLYYFARKPLQK